MPEASRVTVEQPASVREVVTATDARFAAAGLAHRTVATADPLVAGVLAPGLQEVGWRLERALVLVHAAHADRGEPTPAASTVDHATWLAFAEEVAAAHAAARGREAEGADRRSAAAREERARWARRLAAVVDLHCHLLAEADTPLAGWEVHARGPVARIAAVAVHPDARGRGLGRAALRLALDGVRDRAEVVWLAVPIADPTGAAAWADGDVTLDDLHELGFRAAHTTWSWTRDDGPGRVQAAR